MFNRWAFGLVVTFISAAQTVQAAEPTEIRGVRDLLRSESGYSEQARISAQKADDWIHRSTDRDSYAQNRALAEGVGVVGRSTCMQSNGRRDPSDYSAEIPSGNVLTTFSVKAILGVCRGSTRQNRAEKCAAPSDASFSENRCHVCVINSNLRLSVDGQRLTQDLDSNELKCSPRSCADVFQGFTVEKQPANLIVFAGDQKTAPLKVRDYPNIFTYGNCEGFLSPPQE